MPLGADVGILAVSIVAGLIGALAGVGGGLFVVPALSLGFGVDIHLAIGASIVSVIATSSGSAAAYVRDQMTDVPAPADSPSPLAVRLRLFGSYPDRNEGRTVAYAARRIPLGFGLMGIAGLMSGLLGIGSGALKVLAMDAAMGLPIKVCSATSNFMIGVTAAASAGIYLSRGDVDPRIAAPVALGVLLGAVIGARILPHLSNRAVRRIFVPILVLVGLQTLARGFGLV